MDEEKIIRKEAKEFYDIELFRSSRRNAIDDFHKLNIRLNDFYSSENKSIFLDEIELNLKTYLKKHRDKAHNGQPDPNCPIEIKAEKLLFYIQQELNTLPIIAHQRFHTSIKEERKKVFVSYSHMDIEYLKDIKRHFNLFMIKLIFGMIQKFNLGKSGNTK